MCPVVGCGSAAPTTISSSVSEPLSLVVDGTDAYWMAKGTSDSVVFGNSIFSCPLTTCFSPRMVLGPQTYSMVSDLALQASTVYFRNSYQFKQCTASGCDTIFGSGPGDIISGVFAADSTGLYSSWTDDGLPIRRTEFCPFATCRTAGTPLWSSLPSLLTAWQGTVYILDSSGNIGSCPNTGCSNILTPLATNESGVSSMAVDDSGLYWIASGGDIRHCAIPDCAGGPTMLVRGQTNPVSISLSDQYIFWVNRGSGTVPGSVVGLHK